MLLIPLVTMQFTDEVNWTLFDFIVAAVLLFGAGLAIEFIFRKMKRNNYRIAITLAILVMLLLVWAELAVGIFGSPLSGH